MPLRTALFLSLAYAIFSDALRLSRTSAVTRQISMKYSSLNDPRLKYTEKNLIPTKTSTYAGPLNGGEMKTNVFDALNKLGQFNTLITAIKACGLEEKMSTKLTTLFAPTDEAFSRLPAGNVEALLNDIPNLTNLIRFHVHPGKLNCTRNARSFNTAFKNPETGNPKQLAVKVTSWTEEVFIVTGQPNHPQVTTRSIVCTNGLINILSEVMIPFEGETPPQVTFMGARDLNDEATLQRGYYGSIKGTDRFGNFYSGPGKEKLGEYKSPVTREAWLSATHYADPPKNSAGMNSQELFDW